MTERLACTALPYRRLVPPNTKTNYGLSCCGHGLQAQRRTIVAISIIIIIVVCVFIIRYICNRRYPFPQPLRVNRMSLK